ncbi:hypothetical protein LCGC14_2693210 [marine sediment metagenome]|uniref:Uncharacterized protein n=1 Tax=marine sediment metagenome TaxID=412755 RepID=A0A0F9A5F5_9ZZZZ
MGDMSFLEILTWPFGDILGVPDASDRKKVPPVTSLDRQATQADTSARQRLAARRRGSGRQTILSLGGAGDATNLQKPLLGS